MSGSAGTNGLRDGCDCCEGVEHLTPASVENAPSLSALIYRAGTHARFKASMQAALSRQAALAHLTTRDADDPSLALIDACATMLDVLTFYQERIANEGYLRTATERHSVLELARATGYELNPGAAAETYVAFTLDSAAGAPDTAVIQEGTKIQSTPGQGETPQTFETSTEIVAKKEWNALRPRQTRPQELVFTKAMKQLFLLGRKAAFPPDTPDVETISASDFDDVFLLDGSTPLDPAQGDIQALPIDLVFLAGTGLTVKAGDQLLFVGESSDGELYAMSLLVHGVEAEPELNRTRVDLAAQPWSPVFAPPDFPKAAVSPAAAAFTESEVYNLILSQSWTENDLAAFIATQGWDAAQLAVNVEALLAAPPPESDEGVFTFRQRVGFFGHNAPLWGSLPKSNTMRADPYKYVAGDVDFTGNWDLSGGRKIWEDSWNHAYEDTYPGIHVFLERPIPEIIRNSWIVVTAPGRVWAYEVTAVSEISVVGYGMSTKATGIGLIDGNGESLTFWPELNVRRTTAHVQSEQQALAQLPITDPLLAGDKSLMLNGLVLGLQVRQRVVLTGERSDAQGVIEVEVLTLESILHIGGYTTVYFENGLQHSYLRDTVTLNANVAHATHGETRHEILGSGDASQVFQAFTLRQTPLTYRQAATVSGGSSTLEIRVNDILWHEVSSLYGCKPKDRVYVTRMDDNGKVTVQFGDGKRGARLPTGNRNVVATYRTGTGPAGNVQVGQLTTLLSRPLGLREASNPVRGQGGSAPEPRDLARQNAPLHVRTLDRAVSLLDYEDFARAFSGVGKAQAIWLWNGEAQIVHLTLAGDAGEDLEGTTVMSNLQKALNERRDPLVQVRVDTYAPIYFQIQAAVRVHADYDLEQVLTRVRDALRQAFSFEARQFGQAVARSEVIAVIQRTAGVEAVDLNKLTDSQASDVNPARLPAAAAWWNAAAAKIERAQLLTLAETEAAIDLSEMPA